MNKHYLHTHLGLSLGPRELASILAKLESLNETDTMSIDQGPERVRIGSWVRLLDIGRCLPVMGGQNDNAAGVAW